MSRFINPYEGQAKPAQKVVYRVFKGEVLALLPGLSACYGAIVIYARVGQHGEACSTITRRSRLATPNEYEALHRELSGIYSDCTLQIGKRVQYSDLLKGWKRC